MTEQPAGDQPLAFVIEDDPKQAAIFAQALQMAGYATEVVSDGGQALERLLTARPSLVVLDLQLPNASGETVLRQLRAEPTLTGVRVLLATAQDRRAEHLRALSDLILLKPVSFVQLRDLALRLR